MRLRLKNVGKIISADVEINGITVIAGENATGKSTIGKALYCIFNSLYNLERNIELERVYTIATILEKGMAFSRQLPSREFLKAARYILDRYILEKNGEYSQNHLHLLNELSDFYNQVGLPYNSKIDNLAQDIYDALSVSSSEIANKIFEDKVQAEFAMQINSFRYSGYPSEITLEIKGKETKAIIEYNKNINISNALDLNTEVIYIDDPYIVDSLRIPLNTSGRRRSKRYNHRKHLNDRMVQQSSKLSIISEMTAAKKLDNVFERINSVCAGEMVKKTSMSFAYTEKNTKHMIEAENMSTGLKTFAIIKTLLLNGSLEENGALILDEPEIHLHPEWQLVFAEVIVLLQKEFNLHVLMNTHSPYFLDAIDVFSHMHGIADKCKYYLAENIDEIATIKDVSHELNLIYEKLFRPLQRLENERYSI